MVIVDICFKSCTTTPQKKKKSNWHHNNIKLLRHQFINMTKPEKQKFSLSLFLSVNFIKISLQSFFVFWNIILLNCAFSKCAQNSRVVSQQEWNIFNFDNIYQLNNIIIQLGKETLSVTEDDVLTCPQWKFLALFNDLFIWIPRTGVFQSADYFYHFKMSQFICLYSWITT